MWLTFVFLVLLHTNFAFGRYEPCEGAINILLDSSGGYRQGDGEPFTKQQFTNQKELVKKLMVSPYFNSFERLSIGHYSTIVQTSGIGYFKDEDDVVKYVDSIRRDTRSFSRLDDCLDKLDFIFEPLLNITTYIIFVSSLEASEVADALFHADSLQNQGVRIVLIGHGNYISNSINVQQLTNVVQDPRLVFTWNNEDEFPAEDIHQWFNDVLDCPPIKTRKLNTTTTRPQTSSFSVRHSNLLAPLVCLLLLI
ncbi:hypothetical protein M3Y95_01240300 [Aphelenchoides besseyi]|nr:hypothetical protein M3Y95_01240300 [Aphelenchoides besseyi]